MKKQKNKSYELEHIARCKAAANEKHSKSMNEHSLLNYDQVDGDIKSKSNAPALPVLRHLRPEFRAQLPLTVTKKRAPDNRSPSKIPTITVLHDEEPTNGYCNQVNEMNCGYRNELNQSTPRKKANDVCDRNKPKNQSIVKDGHYFMMILDKEMQRLLALATKAEEELETPDLSEDAKGFLRSAAGKARLLVTQKMQQFKGLCTNNLTQVPDEAFPTTNEDLQGFWDMIMLQVNQIDTLFADLDRLKANNWEETPIPSNISTNGKSVKEPKKVVKARPASAATEENRKLREIQRKKLIEEKRKAMREQQQKNKSSRQNIEIFVPESS